MRDLVAQAISLCYPFRKLTVYAAEEIYVSYED